MRTHNMSLPCPYGFNQRDVDEGNPRPDAHLATPTFNHLVYNLYGLTEDEIKIVEGVKYDIARNEEVSKITSAYLRRSTSYSD